MSEVEMEAWTAGRAVDVCLEALSDQLRTGVGECPLAELTGPDGAVVNLTSVHDVMAASFDETILRGARDVRSPLKPHKQMDKRLAGTRGSGVLGVMVAPFTRRPGLPSLTRYLGAEFKRRAEFFSAKAHDIEVDLHAPLDLQARQTGEKVAYIWLSEMTKANRSRAVAPLVSWR